MWRHNWNRSLDGLCALIISPTRELAIQIFDVLRVVGCNHNISAGLVIGGKSFEDESNKINQMNILVCTPGRLLQHLEQSYTFTIDTLKLLVLDEVDRILDMGFQSTVNDILSYLPQQRQTLLFSATINDSVNELARLSLNQPIHIDVNTSNHSNTTNTTNTDSPHTADHSIASARSNDKLEQSYTVVDASQKLDMLFSFIKTHLRSKFIVFVSSCKQVRYLYEIFRRIRPGIPLMHIHGKMSQTRRMQMYYDYCNKQYACIFATDIAARGLDFPAVDWILQLDCPDTPATYIHRIGRTARYKSKGKAMLCLLPSEVKFIEQLQQHENNMNYNIKRLRINHKQLRSTVNQIQAFLAESTDTAELARKAYVSYIRSVYLQSDKSVFDVREIPLEPLAISMGLQRVPPIKFIGTMKHKKNLPYALQDIANKHNKSLLTSHNSSDTSSVDKLLARRNTQYERRLQEINQQSESESDSSGVSDNDSNSVSDILVSKSSNTIQTHNDDSKLIDHDIDSDDLNTDDVLDDNEFSQHIKKQAQKKQLFESYVEKASNSLYTHASATMDDNSYISNVADRISSVDQIDREAEKDRIRQKRLKLKRRQRELNASRAGQSAGAVLKAVHDNESNNENDDGSDSNGDDIIKRNKLTSAHNSNIHTDEQLALQLLQ